MRDNFFKRYIEGFFPICLLRLKPTHCILLTELYTFTVIDEVLVSVMFLLFNICSVKMEGMLFSYCPLYLLTCLVFYVGGGNESRYWQQGNVMSYLSAFL